MLKTEHRTCTACNLVVKNKGGRGGGGGRGFMVYGEMNPITRISKFTKFSNQAVTCQRSPKFHTNVSKSEMAFSPKSIQRL